MKFFEKWGGQEKASEERLAALKAREEGLQKRLRIIEEDMAGPNGVPEDVAVRERIVASLEEVTKEIKKIEETEGGTLGKAA